jgi:hypothetical protein
MGVSPEGTGIAQEIGDGVLFPLDVLARQTVGAVDDKAGKLPCNQLDRLIVRRSRDESAGFVEPSYCACIIAEGKDAVLLAALCLTLKKDEPNGDHHSEEFKDVVGDVDAIDGAQRWYPYPPSTAGQEEAANPIWAQVRPTYFGQLPDCHSVQRDPSVSLCQEEEPQVKVCELFVVEQDPLVLMTALSNAEAESIEEMACKGNYVAHMV